MSVSDTIGAWIHDVIDGSGGLHSFEYHEMATPNIPRDEAVAHWVIRALGNDASKDAQVVFEAIAERRMERKGVE